MASKTHIFFLPSPMLPHTTYANSPTGVPFIDLSPLFADAATRRTAAAALIAALRTATGDVLPDAVVGIDSRGYLVAGMLADGLRAPMHLARKAGKLPPDAVHTVEYKTEYSTATLVMLKGAVAGMRVVVCDDLLATGGTLLAAAELVRMCGGTVLAFAVLHALPGHPALPAPLVTPTSPAGAVHMRPAPLYSGPLVLCHPSMQRVRDTWSPSPGPHITWARFPDGWLDMRIPTPEQLVGRNVLYIGSLHSPEVVAEQVAALTALSRQQMRSLRVCFPWFGPGTMERVDEEGVVATAEPIMKMLTGLLAQNPLFTIFDVHSTTSPLTGEMSRFLYDRRTTSCIPLLLRQLRYMRPRPAICFPDEGAEKRFNAHFDGLFDIIVCGKHRLPGDKRSIDVKRMPDTLAAAPPKMVVVVDDLGQSCGTLLACAALMREQFPTAKLGAYVTHAVMPNNAHLKLVGAFDVVWTTDTVPDTAAKLRHRPPFVVMPFAPLLNGREKWVKHRYYPLDVRSASRAKHHAVAIAEGVLAVNLIEEDEYPSRSPPSGVRNQPFGREEILRGAMNRLKGAARDVLAISMENGIVDGADVGCVVLARNGDVLGVAWTLPTPLPFAVDEATWDQAQTVGQKIDPEHHADWHAAYNGGMSRGLLLANALVSLLA